MTSCVFHLFIIIPVSVFGSDVDHGSLTLTVSVPSLASMFSCLNWSELWKGCVGKESLCENLWCALAALQFCALIVRSVFLLLHY